MRNIGGFIFIVSVLFVFVVVVDLVLFVLFLIIFVMNGDTIRDYESLVSYQNLSNKG